MKYVFVCLEPYNHKTEDCWIDGMEFDNLDEAIDYIGENDIKNNLSNITIGVAIEEPEDDDGRFERGCA